jgi:hypothetical protein
MDGREAEALTAFVIIIVNTRKSLAEIQKSHKPNGQRILMSDTHQVLRHSKN